MRHLFAAIAVSGPAARGAGRARTTKNPRRHEWRGFRSPGLIDRESAGVSRNQR
jgi:hypothetical protein